MQEYEELDERALAAAEWVNKEIRKLIEEITAYASKHCLIIDASFFMLV